MRFFNLSKKNKAVEAARKLLKAAELGELKAQQERDWAESMEVYHRMRSESLREYIARLERIDAPTTSAPAFEIKNEVKRSSDGPSVAKQIEESLRRDRTPKNPPIPLHPTAIPQV
ncbi:hypothetical protein H4CHR_02927 [Variovorax sp. PBS-H4]|uniref:hypothetical protein n=1 Tax=Variovorax sp. PBS-H4 TaxID=434008 RepID=UPI00131724BD|nr:hypothetical protein [Variovorax sp. PBS-H4]VTU32026.1 hypothetical protein H4CHR_02927 [Variovorax sp. PBS-H4]